eukprot:183708-Chlamydomonas_euryale.AAC.1
MGRFRCQRVRWKRLDANLTITGTTAAFDAGCASKTRVPSRTRTHARRSPAADTTAGRTTAGCGVAPPPPAPSGPA